MEKIFGFIGCGSMGGALVRAVSRAVSPSLIRINNRTAVKAEKLAAETKVTVSDAETIAATCDYIFLGVKPNGMENLLSSIVTSSSGLGCDSKICCTNRDIIRCDFVARSILAIKVSCKSTAFTPPSPWMISSIIAAVSESTAAFNASTSLKGNVTNSLTNGPNPFRTLS